MLPEAQIYVEIERSQADSGRAQRSPADGVEAFPGSERWVRSAARPGQKHRRRLRQRQLRGRCCAPMGIDEALRRGASTPEHVAGLGLRGKPTPDGFLEAASGGSTCRPHTAVVVEDALAGIRAGRAGGFQLVIGVAANAATLAGRRAAGGADRVGAADGSPRHGKARTRKHRGQPRDHRAGAWMLVVDGTAHPRCEAAESIFALANGYLGVRGAPEEGTPAFDAGHAAQRLLRELADHIRRRRLRAGAHRPADRRRRPTASHHAPVRRRQAARRHERAIARLPSALPRHARRPAARARSSFDTPSGGRLLVCSRRLASLVHATSSRSTTR